MDLTDKSIHLSDLDDLSISLKISDPKNEKMEAKKINKEDYEKFQLIEFLLIKYILNKNNINKSILRRIKI